MPSVDGDLEQAPEESWVQGRSPQGTYRLLRADAPTALTSLVDRGRPPAEQVRDLHDLEWVPPAVLAATIEEAGRGVSPPSVSPALPRGILSSPFPLVVPQIVCEGGERRHPVRDWFWPALHYSGDPVLAAEERRREILVPTSGSMALHRVGEGREDGLGDELGPTQIKEERCYLTDQRVIRVARRDPASMPPEDQRIWVISHMRWQWVHEIGTLRVVTMGRRGLLARPRAGVEVDAAYFRMRLPGSEEEGRVIYELRFFGHAAQRIYERALELCAIEHERDIGTTDEVVHHSDDARVVRLATPVGGSVPWSMPEKLP